MAEYKLTIVEKVSASDSPTGSLYEKELCTVGYFKTEEMLKKWAEQNNGEIEKC